MQHLWWVISSYQAFLMTWESHQFFLFCKVSIRFGSAAVRAHSQCAWCHVALNNVCANLSMRLIWYDVHMLTDWIPSGPIWLKNMFLTDDETALELLKWFVPWSFKKKRGGGFYYFGGDCSLGPLLVILLNTLGLFVHAEATKNIFFPMSLHTACPAFSICAAPPTELTAVHTTRGWKVTNCSAILCCSLCVLLVVQPLFLWN